MTVSIDFFDNVSERTKDLLLSQFKNRENFGKFLDVINAQWQQLEYVLKDIYDKTRNLDAAIGAQLDGIGEIIGLRRANLDDEHYRSALRFQILLNNSGGESEFLIYALQYLNMQHHFPMHSKILSLQ